MELELLEPPALNHSVVEPVVPSRTLEHRNLRRDDFWSAIPAYSATRADEFHTHTFQARRSVTNVRQLRETLQDLVPDQHSSLLRLLSRHGAGRGRFADVAPDGTEY